MPYTFNTALKEWSIAVSALAAGETVLLLRKGGIREQGSQFSIPQRRIWLYPTYEHQKPHLLKPEYADQVSLVEPGWHPATIEIQAWAEITHGLEVSEPGIVEALLPFHIWNAAFVSERLKWKPRTPLSLLLLRVYQLPQAWVIPYRREYGGCKSWIELDMEGAPNTATPVLSEAAYEQQVAAILAITAPAITKEIVAPQL